ncbi:MAG: hypothetical protein FD170_2084 [Bacteroidetes bacterium]|nr:MAG: hypothetical protein FD170_2084 [Bacteroidota bacterium]
MSAQKSRNEFLLFNVIFPLLLTVAGFVWKFFYITYREISLDEPFTIFHAQQSIWHILSMPAQGEPNPPLFMLLLHFWIQLTGTGPVAVRLLPLLFNSLTVLFIYFSGKRFFGFWPGLLASGMFLLSNFHFFHGLEARTYSLLSLATASSLYFLLQLVKEQGSKKHTIPLLIISNIAMVYSHYFGWFVVFMQLACGLFYFREKKVFKNILISFGVTVVAYLPFFFILFRQFLKSSQGTWVEPPKSGAEYLYQLGHFLNHPEVFRAVLWILAAGLVFMVYKKTWKSIDKELFILFIWWFVPFTLMFLISFEMPVFITRYLLFNSVGLYLFVAVAVSQLFNRNKYLIPAAAIILLAMMANRMKILPDEFSYREVTKATSFVGNHKQVNDVLIIHPYWADMEFAYYYDRSIFTDAENFYERLSQQNIYPVWGLEHAKSVTGKNSSGRIIYYLNGPKLDEDDGIYKYLKENYTMIDSTGFPQTYTITTFER